MMLAVSVGVAALTARNTCAAIGCGHSYDRSLPCQCNSACVSHYDCCSDYSKTCGSGPGPSPSGGGVQRKQITVDGLSRTYNIQMPTGKMPSSGWPVAFGFHGWCSNGNDQAKYDYMRSLGKSTAIVIHPDGESDGTDCPSWNGAGSAGANAAGGLDGPICNNDKVSGNGWKCYPSCEKKGFCTTRGSPNKCRWSHCNDDVAFVLAILDDVKKTTTVDSTKVVASGSSNGGLFMYELASDARSARIFSVLSADSGLPQNGFNRGTLNTQMKFIEFAGTTDNYVYPYPNVASDPTKSYGSAYGWYYSAWDNTTNLWARQMGLKGDRKSLSAPSGLDCRGWSTDGSASGTQVTTCFFNGGHCRGPQSQWTLTWELFGIESS